MKTPKKPHKKKKKNGRDNILWAYQQQRDERKKQKIDTTTNHRDVSASHFESSASDNTHLLDEGLPVFRLRIVPTSLLSYRSEYCCVFEMRLVTHNMLKCNVKGVENGYPLRIEVEKSEIIPCDYDSGE